MSLPDDKKLEEIALSGGFIDCLGDLPDDHDEAIEEMQRILARYYRTVYRRFMRQSDANRSQP